MDIIRKNGSTSNVIRVTLRASSTGDGLTGLSNASTGLIISTICDNEATPTAYTVAASNIESISTLATYSAPTSGKCRFKEVDATNNKGLYELQIADARFAVGGAKVLRICISGASGLLLKEIIVQLTTFDLDAANSVLAQAVWDVLTSALTQTNSIGKMLVDRIDAAISSRSTYAGGDTSGVTTLLSRIGSAINISGGRVDSNVVYWNGVAVATPDAAGYPKITIKTGTGTGELVIASGVLPSVGSVGDSEPVTPTDDEFPTAEEIADEVRVELTAELAKIDANVSSAVTPATTAASTAAAINTKLGTPSGASVSADIAALGGAGLTNDQSTKLNDIHKLIQSQNG